MLTCSHKNRAQRRCNCDQKQPLRNITVGRVGVGGVCVGCVEGRPTGGLQDSPAAHALRSAGVPMNGTWQLWKEMCARNGAPSLDSMNRVNESAR